MSSHIHANNQTFKEKSLHITICLINLETNLFLNKFIVNIIIMFIYSGTVSACEALEESDNGDKTNCS